MPVCADNKVDTIALTSLSKGIDMARQRILTLSDEQLGVLQHERLHHEHSRVRQRMDVIWLRANGLTQLRVAEMLGISRHTVADYENLYEAGGIDALKDFKWSGRVSPLQAYSSEIEAFLEEHPPRTLEEACDLIEELTGIRREKSFVREFLHSLKIRRLKTGMIPAKADSQQQQEFLKKSLNHV
jgi:transposase